MTEEVIIDGVVKQPKPHYLTKRECENIAKLKASYDNVAAQNKQLQQELREETVERVRLKAQYDKVVEQNRQLQAELREKTAECGELKIKLMQAAGWYKTSDGRYLNKM